MNSEKALFVAEGGKGDVHLYGDVVIYGQERSVLEELQAMA